MSSDWCYPLCALVTLVLRLLGFDNPCRLGTEIVSLSVSYQACPCSVTSALHSSSGTCPLHPRLETAYHRCGFQVSVDPTMVGYRRCSGCQPESTSTSSSLLLQEPSWPSVPRGRRGSGTALAVLHACPCSFWNWRLVYYSTS